VSFPRHPLSLSRAYGCGALTGARGGSLFFSGQDNPSDLCIVGDVRNIFEGHIDDHHGPYGGIMINC
jgi:hypothetical protein